MANKHLTATAVASALALALPALALPALASGQEAAPNDSSCVETGMIKFNASGFYQNSCEPLWVTATTLANLSSGDFAPYYIMSNKRDIAQQGYGIQEKVSVEKAMGDSRFAWAFGASALAGYTSSVDYSRYEAENKTFTKVGRHPGRVSLRELWAAVKYRNVYLSAGMNDNHCPVIGSDLGSGDLVMSRNARSIPQVRVGFLDFCDIPFTNGWVQIFGDLGYGKFADSGYLKDHYNYYNSFITTGVYMQYSRAYFRVGNGHRLSGTIGMQHATQFGGTWQQYGDGHEWSSQKNPVKIKDFFNAFFPWTGGSSTINGEEAYFNGNHIGSWDLALDYTIPGDRHRIGLYIQSPWEDGSGIGKLNGFDGVWGLKYRNIASHRPILRTAVIEYIDLTNQSGPMHWAPDDYPDSGIPGQATGADDYYNNYMYNGWANYGMAIGSPFVKSPIYNTDGYMRFTDNRVRGFHVAAAGCITDRISWEAALSYRTSWGTPYLPSPEKRHDTSMALSVGWDMPGIFSHWYLSGTLAFDAGSLYGDNFGALIALSYNFTTDLKQ